MIKVLILDDSVSVRNVLKSKLSSYSDIEVFGTSAELFIAKDMIARLKPDVVILDVEMPDVDGIKFLLRLMPQYPVRIVISSFLTPKGGDIKLLTFETGAIDFVTKLGIDIAQQLFN